MAATLAACVRTQLKLLTNNFLLLSILE